MTLCLWPWASVSSICRWQQHAQQRLRLLKCSLASRLKKSKPLILQLSRALLALKVLGHRRQSPAQILQIKTLGDVIEGVSLMRLCKWHQVLASAGVWFAEPDPGNWRCAGPLPNKLRKHRRRCGFLAKGRASRTARSTVFRAKTFCA